jgi:HTH-type transcriptional regulator/antitoxin HigA
MIRTEQDHQAALRRIDELIDSEHEADLDELDVLSVLVRDYETTHRPMPPPEPIAALEFIMEQRGLTRKDLELVLGCKRGRVSEILNRTRSLSISQIRILHREWRIPWDCLLGEDLEQTGT